MKKCPSCKNDVPFEELHCPFCPYSFPDPDTQGKPQTAITQPKTLAPALWGAVALAALFGVVKFLNFAERGLTNLGLGKEGVEQRKKEEHSGGKKGGKDGGHVSYSTRRPGEPETASPPPEETSFVSVSAVGPAEAPEPEEAVTEWRLRGKIYDLVSLRPLAGCKVVFSDIQTNARHETVSGAGGLYRVILPPLPERGYVVTIAQKGYAKSYLDPSMRNVSKMPGGRRSEMSVELAKAVRPPSTLQPPGAAPLVTDFYLAPLSP